jgi:hypothetical protein
MTWLIEWRWVNNIIERSFSTRDDVVHMFIVSTRVRLIAIQFACNMACSKQKERHEDIIIIIIIIVGKSGRIFYRHFVPFILSFSLVNLIARDRQQERERERENDQKCLSYLFYTSIRCQSDIDINVHVCHGENSRLCQHTLEWSILIVWLNIYLITGISLLVVSSSYWHHAHRDSTHESMRHQQSNKQTNKKGQEENEWWCCYVLRSLFISSIIEFKIMLIKTKEGSTKKHTHTQNCSSRV